MKNLTELHPNYIDGEWRLSDESIQVVNPSDTREIVGEFALASSQDVSDAVISARQSLSSWSLRSPLFRSEVLDRAGQTIFSRREELGLLLAREEGKPIAEAIGEVVRASQIFRFFAHEAVRLSGESGPSIREGVDVFVTRESVGVVGVISPWNFPIAIPAWKIAPALAFGNCVVFKPAEWSPASAWMLTKILVESGLPPGVLNLTMGAGLSTGRALVAAVGLDALTFTGSQITGRLIAEGMIQRGIKLQLEMGGKNPLVVLDDADLGIAVDCAVQSGYFSTGQRCTASSRVIVTAGIHDEFIKAMAQATQDLRVGAATDGATQIGPVVHERQLDKVMDYVGIGIAEGARLVVGGSRVKTGSPGHYMTPALFADTTQDMRINREEIFGPVVSVMRATDYEDALTLANCSEFGLSAGIVTNSLSKAKHFQRHAQAGMVMVNLPTAGVDFHAPFGGSKSSSYGSREQGTHAKEFYTRVKTAYVR